MKTTLKDTVVTTRRLQIVCVFTAFASTILSYRGLRLIQPMPIAMLLSLVSLAVQLVAWGFLLRVWSKSSPAEHGQLIRVLGLPVGALILMTSTLVGSYSLAMPEAMRLARISRADEASGVVQALKGQLAQEDHLVAALTASSGDMQRAAASERETGRFTGRRSKGKVFADLSALASSYEQAATLLSESKATREGALHRADALVLELQQLATRPATSADALEASNLAFSEKLLQLNTLLEKASTSVVEQALLGVDGGTEQQKLSPLTARSRKKRERQREATSAITKISALAQARVHQVAQQLPTQQVERRILRMPLPVEALEEQFVTGGLGVYLAYMVAVDFIPVLALMMLGFLTENAEPALTGQRPMAAKRPAPRQGEAAPPLSSVSSAGLGLAPSSALGALRRRHAGGGQ